MFWFLSGFRPVPWGRFIEPTFPLSMILRFAMKINSKVVWSRSVAKQNRRQEWLQYWLSNMNALVNISIFWMWEFFENLCYKVSSECNPRFHCIMAQVAILNRSNSNLNNSFLIALLCVELVRARKISVCVTYVLDLCDW